MTINERLAFGGRVFLRVLKEYGIPLLLALSIALWANWPKNAGLDWKKFGASFGASFFVICWYSGQLFRIAKQQRVDRQFDQIQNRLEGLLQQLEIATKQIVGNTTGGDSFVQMQLLTDGITNGGQIVFVHHGEFPLYDIQVRIVDLVKSKKDMAGLQAIPMSVMNKYETILDLGTSTPNHAKMATGLTFSDAQAQDYNIFYTARNGSTTQILRLRNVNGKWVSATKIKRYGDGKRPVIYENIAEGFPMDTLDKEWKNDD